MAALSPVKYRTFEIFVINQYRKTEKLTQLFLDYVERSPYFQTYCTIAIQCIEFLEPHLSYMARVAVKVMACVLLRTHLAARWVADRTPEYIKAWLDKVTTVDVKKEEEKGDPRFDAFKDRVDAIGKALGEGNNAFAATNTALYTLRKVVADYEMPPVQGLDKVRGFITTLEGNLFTLHIETIAATCQTDAETDINLAIKTAIHAIEDLGYIDVYIGFAKEITRYTECLKTLKKALKAFDTINTYKADPTAFQGERREFNVPSFRLWRSEAKISFETLTKDDPLQTVIIKIFGSDKFREVLGNLRVASLSATPQKSPPPKD